MVNNIEQFDSQTEIRFQKNKSIQNSPFRVYILLFSFIFAFSTIGIQMILMAVNPAIIEKNKKIVLKEDFERKEIKDRNGILLAKNIKVDSFYAHPFEIVDKEKVLNSLKIIFSEDDRRFSGKNCIVINDLYG